MLEVPIEGVQDEAEGDICPDAAGGTIAPKQEAPQFATPWASSCPAATRYNLTPSLAPACLSCREPGHGVREITT